MNDLRLGLIHGMRVEVGRGVPNIPPAVAIVNPLANALDHYMSALRESLRQEGFDPLEIVFPEPSKADSGRLRWVLNFYIALVRARFSGARRIIATWAPLGYIDVALLPLIGGRSAWIVIHDPLPLASTTGYDAISIRAARVFGSQQIIVHSEAAAAEITKVLGRRPKTVLPLPLLPREVNEQPRNVDRRQSILVFGQFKPDRDIALLTRLGDQLASEYELNIVGRRWPTVPGWNVRDEFIPEAEVEPLLSAASVVLIPYRRFYQSDVAIRCIELGVPVVGLASSSLREMLGADSPLLVPRDDAESWVDTIRSAARTGRAAVRQSRTSLYEETLSAWAAWAKQ
jgi:hypothetical protein